MAGGNLLHNAPPDELVGDLAPRPLADRPVRLAGDFAGERDDLALLLGGDRRPAAGTGDIGEPLRHRQVVQLDRR